MTRRKIEDLHLYVQCEEVAGEKAKKRQEKDDDNNDEKKKVRIARIMKNLAYHQNRNKTIEECC